MEEMSLQDFVKGYYAGSMDDSMIYINLVIQAASVLIAGIVLWRASVIFHNRKKAQRNSGKRLETIYSKEWRRR